MTCPHCGFALRLCVRLEESVNPNPPAIEPGRDNGAVFNAEMMKFEGYCFMDTLRERVRPFTANGLLECEAWRTKNFGPVRFSRLIHALLRSGVSTSQILGSTLWRTAHGSYGWRANAHFQKLARELDGQS